MLMDLHDSLKQKQKIKSQNKLLDHLNFYEVKEILYILEYSKKIYNLYFLYKNGEAHYTQVISFVRCG